MVKFSKFLVGGWGGGVGWGWVGVGGGAAGGGVVGGVVGGRCQKVVGGVGLDEVGWGRVVGRWSRGAGAGKHPPHPRGRSPGFQFSNPSLDPSFLISLPLLP